MSWNRPKRAAALAANAVTTTPTPTSSRSTRTRGVKVETKAESEAESEEVPNDEEGEVEPEAGPSRQSRTSARKPAQATPKSAPAKRSSRGRVRVEEPEEDEDEDDEVQATPSKRTRLRKSVSYAEVPIEADEEEEDDEEVDVPPPRSRNGRRRTSRATSTPQRKDKAKSESDGDEEEEATPALDKVGTGKGGFSVKGAAAAAARARWAKFREAKAERGEDDDDDRPRSRNKKKELRPSKIASETYKPGTTISIKGEDYTVGDDELEIPENEKGNTKIDAFGRLQGGREYKFFTFNSPTRRNPERVYALTIDVARACGYSDSLAFLRRCPQILKLACNNEEREMLMEIGRVAANLKNRMVTILTVRNAFKLMGARLIKNGKWVTDDYDETDALAKCQESGFTPYGLAHEDEIASNAMSTLAPVGRPSLAQRDLGIDGGSFSKTNAMTPFYTVGGPTTHFAGSGIDPWVEAAAWGGVMKRNKLRNAGITEEDWMYRTAEESRRIDAQLKEYREERLVVMDESEAPKGWVYVLEKETDEEVNGDIKPNGFRRESRADTQERITLPETPMGGLRPPKSMRKRSALSQEITMEDEEALNPLNGSGTEEVQLVNGIHRANGENSQDVKQAILSGEGRGGNDIVVQTPQQDSQKSAYRWGLGDWEAGSVKAAYEPHTHMPHIPLYTQPSSASLTRMSQHPILTSQADPSRRNFVQSSVGGKAARGLASLEYAFESQPPSYIDPIGWNSGGAIGNGDDDEVWTLPGSFTIEEQRQQRLQEVEDATRWEMESRKKQHLARTTIES